MRFSLPLSLSLFLFPPFDIDGVSRVTDYGVTRRIERGAKIYNPPRREVTYLTQERNSLSLSLFSLSVPENLRPFFAHRSSPFRKR